MEERQKTLQNSRDYLQSSLRFERKVSFHRIQAACEQKMDFPGLFSGTMARSLVGDVMSFLYRRAYTVRILRRIKPRTQQSRVYAYWHSDDFPQSTVRGKCPRVPYTEAGSRNNSPDGYLSSKRNFRTTSEMCGSYAESGRNGWNEDDCRDDMRPLPNRREKGPLFAQHVGRDKHHGLVTDTRLPVQPPPSVQSTTVS